MRSEHTLLLTAVFCVIASCHHIGPSPRTVIGEPARHPAPAEPRTDIYDDPLPAGALVRCGSVRFRGDAYLNELAFSPDGKRIALADSQFVYTMYASTGRRLDKCKVLPGSGGWRSGYVGAIAYTKRGEVIAANLEGERVMYERFEGSFVVRDTSGAELFRIDREQHGITDRGTVTLSPDGSVLAIAGGRDTGWAVLLFGVSTGEELMRVGSSKERPCLAFSADSRMLALGAGEAQVWDISARRLLRTFPTFADRVYPVALSPQGNTVAFREGGGAISLCDTRTGRRLRELRIDDVHVPCMVFSPDGKALAFAYNSERVSRIELWNVASGDRLWRAEGAGARSLAFSPDGAKLAASCASSVRVWKTKTGAELTPRSGHEGPVDALRFSGDGTRIISGASGFVWVWEAATGKALRKFGGDTGWGPGTVSFNPSLPHFAVVGGLDRVGLWDVKTGTRVLEVDTPVYYGCEPVVSSAGVIATAGMPRRYPASSTHIDTKQKCLLSLFNRDGEEIVTHDMKNVTIYCMAFSPSGKTLATTNGDRTVKFLDVQTGDETVRAWGREEEPGRLTFSSDGTKLAVGGYRCEFVSIWNVARKERVLDLAGHETGPTAITFSADGNVVATATRDGTVRLWHAETGGKIMSFKVPGGAVHSLAFSPDGRRLATGNADTTILIWDLPALKSKQRAREW
jgi:WD40 repeat protein